MQRILRFLFKTKFSYILLSLLVILLMIWVVFYDTHSVTRRVQWGQEKQQLEQENEVLESKLNATKEAMQRADSSEIIEKQARETYGMRKPGETVYRIDTTQTNEQ